MRENAVRSANKPEPALSPIIIKGITKSGQVFRPSDWAQRLALSASAGTCSVDRPICYHPHVRIGGADGAPAVIIDRCLAEENAELFAFLMDFAKQNDLQVVD